MAKRKKPSKSEMKLRRVKYKNNKEIKDIQDKIKFYSKQNPDTFIKTDSGNQKVSTIKNNLFKKVWEINDNTEKINQKIEKRFCKKVRRSGNKKTADEYPKRKKGSKRLDYHSWLKKDAQKEIFNTNLQFFNGIDLRTDADDAEFTLDNIFMQMGKYDTFVLIRNNDLTSTYEIIINGYYTLTDEDTEI